MHAHAPLLNYSCPQLADHLNRTDNSLRIDPALVTEGLISRFPSELLRTELYSREHLFSPTPVYISQTEILAMEKIIHAIEHVVRSEGYRQNIRDRSGDSVLFPDAEASPGMLLGYDFHLSVNGPKLIEINTNAGGAFLVTEMVRAIHSSSPADEKYHLFGETDPQHNIANYFLKEWEASGRSGQPVNIAITDDNPTGQYLYPDMLIAGEQLGKLGINVDITDASEFEFQDGALLARGKKIDFVYNRITDFSLSDPAHSVLRKAYMENAALISPAPHHHALYADKRNLSIFNNAALPEAWGMTPDIRSEMKTIPFTQIISRENARELWENRKKLFFKPSCGFGSKAVYRGDKITKHVWESVSSGNYVAQENISPPSRSCIVDDSPVMLKFDIRAYVYNRKMFALTARLYNGQTTNFRTPGGGFAAVYIVPDQQ